MHSQNSNKFQLRNRCSPNQLVNGGCGRRERISVNEYLIWQFSYYIFTLFQRFQFLGWHTSIQCSLLRQFIVAREGAQTISRVFGWIVDIVIWYCTRSKHNQSAIYPNGSIQMTFKLIPNCIRHKGFRSHWHSFDYPQPQAAKHQCSFSCRFYWGCSHAIQVVAHTT